MEYVLTNTQLKQTPIPVFAESMNTFLNQATAIYRKHNFKAISQLVNTPDYLMVHFRSSVGFLSTTHTWAIKTLIEFQIVMDMMLMMMDNCPRHVVIQALNLPIHTYEDDTDHDDSPIPIFLPMPCNHFI